MDLERRAKLVAEVAVSSDDPRVYQLVLVVFIRVDEKVSDMLVSLGLYLTMEACPHLVLILDQVAYSDSILQGLLVDGENCLKGRNGLAMDCWEPVLLVHASHREVPTLQAESLRSLHQEDLHVLHAVLLRIEHLEADLVLVPLIVDFDISVVGDLTQVSQAALSFLEDLLLWSNDDVLVLKIRVRGNKWLFRDPDVAISPLQRMPLEVIVVAKLIQGACDIEILSWNGLVVDLERHLVEVAQERRLDLVGEGNWLAIGSLGTVARDRVLMRTQELLIHILVVSSAGWYGNSTRVPRSLKLALDW